MKLSKLACVMVLCNIPQGVMASEIDNEHRNKTGLSYTMEDLFLLDNRFGKYNFHLSALGRQIYTAKDFLYQYCLGDKCTSTTGIVHTSINLTTNNMEHISVNNNSIYPWNDSHSSLSKNLSTFVGNYTDFKNGKHIAFYFNRDIGRLMYLYANEDADEVFVTAISADGGTSIGKINKSKNQGYRAFRYDYHENNSKVTDLGTLRKDNRGNAVSQVVSANGDLVAGISDTDNGAKHVFRHNKYDNKMKDVGSIFSPQEKRTQLDLVGISENGDVIIGNGYSYDHRMRLHSQAFFHHKDVKPLTEIPTLRADGVVGYSSARKISKDGSVIVGQIETMPDYDDDFADKKHRFLGDKHAFRFDRINNELVDLGKLGKKNMGHSSEAIDVSADGRVVIGSGIGKDDGSYYSDDHEYAFIHLKGENEIVELVGLATSNFTSASQISDDGRVVAGYSWLDNQRHPILWKIDINDQPHLESKTFNQQQVYSYDDEVMLGDAPQTDVASNLMQSEDEKLGENTELAKYSKAASNEKLQHINTKKVTQPTQAAVVKINKLSESEKSKSTEFKKQNKSSTNIVISNPVDVINSQIAMQQTANKAYRVLDMYQASLFKLNNTQCDINDSNYCIGLFSDYTKLSRNEKVGTGLFSALKLADSSWIIGAAVDFTPYARLEQGYEAQKNIKPAVGLFARYQAEKENAGLELSFSSALIKQEIDITREQLSYTELGKGRAKLSGYLIGVNAGYGIKLGENSQIKPQIEVKNYAVSRSAYQENNGAQFKADYQKLGYNRTDLGVNLQLIHQITPSVSLLGRGGMDVKLKDTRNNFVGNIDHIGAHSIDINAAKNRLSPHASVRVIAYVSPKSTISTSVGWMKTAYNNDALNAGLTYSYHW